MASAFENRLRRTIEMAGTDGQAGPVPVMATPSGPGVEEFASGARLLPRAGLLPAPAAASAMASGRVAVPDESLMIVPGGPMDHSSMRKTAVPAGSKGRVTTSGTKLLEGGSGGAVQRCDLGA